MATSWFRFPLSKKNKAHGLKNGVTVKDEEERLMKNSKSANLAPPKFAENGIAAKSNSLDHDGDMYGLQTLEEALQSLADNSQPLVARSTPKGVAIDTSGFSSKEMMHCLYEKPVYEAMLKDSMSVCENLQQNLDGYIDEVRKSPAREISPKSKEETK